MIRCPKYMNTVKNQLSGYRNTLGVEKEHPAHLPPLQEEKSRLTGGVEDVALEADATGSGFDDTEQGDLVSVLIIHAVYVTDAI